MTPEELDEVTKLVNEAIRLKLPVTTEEMTLEEAKKIGAIGVFDDKYDEKVKVYSIGDFSKEICGGPHVSNTSELGEFEILKEQSSSAGVRRIKARLSKVQETNKDNKENGKNERKVVSKTLDDEER